MTRDAVRLAGLSVDRASPVPLWHQLADGLEAALSDGRLNPGDRLEDEGSLASSLGVSRSTSRQAIQALAKKGLVVRRRGAGTQVVNAQVSRGTRAAKMLEGNDEQHGETETLLDLGCGPEDKETAALLELVGADADLIRVRRLQTLEGSPLAILTDYVPAQFKIDVHELARHGLSYCLSRRGVQQRVVHQKVGARQLSGPEAQLLGETATAAALTVTRSVHDGSGRFVGLGRHVFIASRYSLEFSLVS